MHELTERGASHACAFLYDAQRRGKRPPECVARREPKATLWAVSLTAMLGVIARQEPCCVTSEAIVGRIRNSRPNDFRRVGMSAHHPKTPSAGFKKARGTELRAERFDGRNLRHTVNQVHAHGRECFGCSLQFQLVIRVYIQGPPITWWIGLVSEAEMEEEVSLFKR